MWIKSIRQFLAVYIDLDFERESCLDFDQHESEFLIQIIEIVVEKFGLGRFPELFPFLANNF